MKKGTTYLYATTEEFMAVLAKGGFVPVKYKTCNTNGFHEYFINEDCDIIAIKSNKKNDLIKYSYFKYDPTKSKNNSGYHIVNIGFSALLHRVMAYTFIGNPTDEQRDINHINNNKDDNRVCNLEYCTHSYNMKEYHKMKMEV